MPLNLPVGTEGPAPRGDSCLQRGRRAGGAATPSPEWRREAGRGLAPRRFRGSWPAAGRTSLGWGLAGARARAWLPGGRAPQAQVRLGAARRGGAGPGAGAVGAGGGGLAAGRASAQPGPSVPASLSGGNALPSLPACPCLRHVCPIHRRPLPGSLYLAPSGTQNTETEGNGPPRKLSLSLSQRSSRREPLL